MRLATIRYEGRTWAARIEGEKALLYDARDVGELLRSGEVMGGLSGQEEVALSEVSFAPVVLRPGKIICLGHNYLSHVREMGREVPKYPTLFCKWPEALIGANDDIELPPESEKPDWEVELAFVIGKQVRRVPKKDALDAIWGYTICNDISMRDWQSRTLQWLQGKTWEHSTPLGPVLVSGDEIEDARSLIVRCEVDGELMQEANTSDLIFDPATIVSYVSTFCTLEPGDVISTGTPGGVGDARKPPIYLVPGQTVRTSIEGIGECANRCVAEKLQGGKSA
jgi:acylpyruvate hydrolase